MHFLVTLPTQAKMATAIRSGLLNTTLSINLFKILMSRLR